MKLKSMLYLFACLPVIATADVITERTNIVTFNVETEKEVSRDLIRVFMYTQEEGKDIKVVNKAITERLNWAIAEVKKQSAVEIREQNRSTQVRYNSLGKQNGWLDRADLVLQSKDSTALAELVAKLNDKLVIDQMTSTVSGEKLKDLEEEMTKSVLTKFEQKANQIQQLMKAKGYRVIELNLGNPDEIGVHHSPRMYSAKMMEASSSSDVQIENGSSTVKTRMNAKIELITE